MAHGRVVCPWFAKSALRLLAAAYIAELSKPCANLALPCSTTAFSWGPVPKDKEKACERHSNVTSVVFFLLYLFGKHPYMVVQHTFGTNLRWMMMETP